MTYNQIREFLAVCQYQSFSEAARHLYITQPALSRQITSLEYELNMQLFFRTTKGLKLTPAGEYLSEKWSEMISLWDHSIAQAAKISEGFSGNLYIGVLDGMDVGAFLSPIIREFEECYPNIHLRLKRYSFGELRTKLYQDELQAIITYSKEKDKMIDVDYKDFIAFHPAWAVPKSNPLSEKDTLEWSDFKNEELVITDTSDCLFGEQYIIELCKKYGGFYPKFYYVDTVDDTLLQLELTNRCTILNMEFTVAKSEKIKMFPIPDEQEGHFFSLVWKKDTADIGLKLFLKILK